MDALLLTDKDVILLLQKFFVKVRLEVEFNGVVARCNRLDVPLLEAHLLYFLYVVQVEMNEQGDEYGC